MGFGYGSHWNMMGWDNGGFWPLGMIVWSAVIIGAVALIGSCPGEWCNSGEAVVITGKAGPIKLSRRRAA